MAKTIDDLYELYENLYESVLQLASNNVPVVDKVDSTANKVDALTPYTQTKTAYIGDREIYFNGVTDGIPTIYVTDTEGNTPRYTVAKAGEGVVSFRIRFEMPLEYVTTITISIS